MMQRFYSNFFKKNMNLNRLLSEFSSKKWSRLSHSQKTNIKMILRAVENKTLEEAFGTKFENAK